MSISVTTSSQVPLTKRPEYLTFDCYGTLIDWRKGIEAGLKALFGDGLKIDGADLMSLFASVENEEERRYRKYRIILADTAKSLAKRLGMEISDRQASDFANSLPSWPAFDDTVRQLKELGRLGYKRYILSNVDNDLLEGTIKRNGLEVEGFVTAEEVHSYKPASNHWLAFLKKVGTDREKLLHVAQSTYHDIVPASALGIASAWINRYAVSRPRDPRATFTCSNLVELTKILVSGT